MADPSPVLEEKPDATSSDDASALIYLTDIFNTFTLLPSQAKEEA
jgi:hypothetical protein